MNRGVMLALGAYTFWGLHPIYWKQLSHISPDEIVSHRIIWSLLFFVIIISLRKQWLSMGRKISESRNIYIFFIPAVLIGTNWATYIWAVNAGYIIETSLGYFISPLVSVFLGVLILKEKLGMLKWMAITVAGIGVLVMTFFYGQFPWIALYLAGSWGTYGLLRKKSPLSAVEGLTLEIAVLSIFSLVYLFYLYQVGTFSFGNDLRTSLLLAGSGILSGLPLIIFIAGARMIPLSLIGILQYIYPTLIFMVGYFVYHESLTGAKLIGFCFIWCAVCLYIIDITFADRLKSLAPKKRK